MSSNIRSTPSGATEPGSRSLGHTDNDETAHPSADAPGRDGLHAEFSNQALNCDNRELFRRLPDNSIDLIITDPPYKDYQSNRPVKREKVAKIHAADFDVSYFIGESARVLKPGRHFYCWCDHLTFPGIFQLIADRSSRRKAGGRGDALTYRNCIVWVKNNHGSGNLKGNYAPQHEFIIFATKGKGRPLNGRRPSNVLFKRTSAGIEFYKKVDNYRFEHGASKPVEILKRLIEISSDPGELVLDPYAGAMSTGEACVDTGRMYLLCERDEDHYTRGIARLNRLIPST